MVVRKRCLSDGKYLSVYLLAVDTLQGKQFLIAAETVVVPIFLDKALGANGLLAGFADKAILMPTVIPMLHLLGAWNENIELQSSTFILNLFRPRNSVKNFFPLPGMIVFRHAWHFEEYSAQ